MRERFFRRKIEDEEFWLDLQAGKFYGVNAPATAILEAWREGVRAPEAIAERLVGAFEVSREEALSAVNAFLAQARERSLLED